MRADTNLFSGACPHCGERISASSRADRAQIITSCPACRGRVIVTIEKGAEKVEYTPAEHKTGTVS